MQNVDAAGGNRPGPGGYIIEITRVMNNLSKQRLEIEYDIANGEHKGYYADLQSRRNFWGGKFIKSYKENAKPFLKAFIQTVQECNGGAPGLVIGDFEDIDESKLVGCKVGIVYGYEEYIGNDGKLKQRVDHFGAEFVNLETIEAGEYTVPDLKLLDGAPAQAVAEVVDTTVGFGQVQDNDMPF